MPALPSRATASLCVLWRLAPLVLLASTLRAAPPIESPRSTIDNPPPAPTLAPTLAQDLTTFRVPLLNTYADQHPRLLFATPDLPALKQKAAAHPELWKPVLTSAKRLATVPTPEQIKTGANYWRIERVESAALAYFVTADKAYLDAALTWMIPHCREQIWGTGFRDNLDLQASWYLYHLSVAYDILYHDIPATERKIITDGLAAHARAIFESFDPAQNKEKLTFDQNHTYIPAVALAAASLALLDDVPAAKDWLNRAGAVMQRCRYVMGDDGYYYEGYGYWSYALHWHVRYADLLSRATGTNALDLPALQNNWKFGLYLSLPGPPYAFDIDDTGKWVFPNPRPNILPSNYAFYWDLASAFHTPEDATVAKLYHDRSAPEDYPAAAFLWHSDIASTPLEKIKPYHHFTDQDVLSWRSGWDENATCLLFRCGPPEGHAALGKLQHLQDWTMNAGHVHPDIGGFYLFAKGAYLAVSTGYTAEKWTRDHNTLLVDDQGQGNDGSYWNDRGIPYGTLNQCRITRTFLADDYAFATGELGPAYTRIPGLDLTRSLVATKRYVLIIDDMSAREAHTLTWLVHADAEFKPDGRAFLAQLPRASLAVFPLSPAELVAMPSATTVMAGDAPGKATPTRRGYQLALTMKGSAKSARLVTLLVPMGAADASPAVESSTLAGNTIALQIRWPGAKTESVSLHLQWQPPADPNAAVPGPATFTTK